MKCSYNPNPKEIWDEAEVVIFHGRHITKDHPVPTYRPPRQKWLFYESEPPLRVWDRVKVLNDVWGEFNFTSTYMDDSDLPYSYFKLECEKVKGWKPSGINWAQNKTKTTAWWVSHCKCDSRREMYVEEMKKFLQVDVMGSCGTPKCGSYVEGPRCVEDLLHNDYKFYLAFENSFCKEYYTEKLSKCLSINVIPVLMGLHDYTDFMPEGSYLDVRDFKGPQHLAEFMNYLDKNDTAYNEYIERRSTVKCEKRDKLPFSCVLCQYLHEHRHQRQIAPDTRKTFNAASHCISPKKFFKGIAEGIYSTIDTPEVFEEIGNDMEWTDEKIIV
ncbi:hypothetical protein CAPTEDRAFT_126510 [Capitella teleta]|uniref:Fucosyltransferase n=1 Tax=Capitella teleta TaxID=283909 RepID=R7U224_CAPTE|nr:hypothetical protein CAPTEDRAFT_126510 [Capitella teleta]|eukprot:ELT99917.1 hypothetical protein CAPTEDRAFT_126510 [Capitella teleta]